MDLKVIGIRDAGTEKERLLLVVEKTCQLYGYMVMDNTYNDNGSLSNTHRHVFIFPDVAVEEGNIVRLYTRKGTVFSKKGTFGEKEVLYHNFYWGMDEGCSVWNQKEDTPYLIHFDVSVPSKII